MPEGLCLFLKIGGAPGSCVLIFSIIILFSGGSGGPGQEILSRPGPGATYKLLATGIVSRFSLFAIPYFEK